MNLNICPLMTSYLPPLTKFKRQKDVEAASVSYIKMHAIFSFTAPPQVR